MLLLACNVRGDAFILDLEPGCEEEFHTLITQYPPPFEYTPGNKAQNPAAGAVLIRLARSNWKQEFVPGKAALQKVIKCTWFVPVAYTWDNKDNADYRDLAIGTEIMPLEAVTLPRKALAYEGLYPPDPGYRLTEKVILTISLLKGAELPDALLTWFNAVAGPCNAPMLSWLGCVGDVMPGEGAEAILLPGQGIQGIFTDTLPLLQSFDILAGNLEAAATTYAVKTPKSFNYRFKPEILGLLKRAGFDYFALANNHCYDFGEAGFRDTLVYLEQYGIPTSGAGSALEAAQVPWCTTAGGQKFAFLSLGAYARERNGFDGYRQAAAGRDKPGILWADAAGLAALAANCRPDTFDVVLVHGGTERTLLPDYEQQRLYRQFIDLGADLVLGSHPHALQGLETYKEKLIAYSLGNFLFPDEVIYKYATESVIISLGIAAGQVRYVKIYPVTMKGTTVELDPMQKGLKRILELTRDLYRGNSKCTFNAKLNFKIQRKML